MATFDLDAVVAEAHKGQEPAEPFVFRFGGEDYTLPGEADTIALALLMSGDMADVKAGLAKLLGPDQWARVVVSPATLTTEHARALIEGYVGHVAQVSAGKSEASSDS